MKGSLLLRQKSPTFRFEDQAAAEKILPLIHDHHLLLVRDLWCGEVLPLV